MDDMGWCPIPSCQQIAHLEVGQNLGKCTHCEFRFCIGCREHVHPFKRCKKHRIDLLPEYEEMFREISEKNKDIEKRLTTECIKRCTKFCPNPKCGVRIAKEKSGCTHVQCT